MSGWAPPPQAPAASADELADRLEQRLRQAALGCTTHGHGPINALVVLLDAHEAGLVDGAEVCARAAARCRHRLTMLEADSLAATRELKVAAVLDAFARGLA